MWDFQNSVTYIQLLEDEVLHKRVKFAPREFIYS